MKLKTLISSFTACAGMVLIPAVAAHAGNSEREVDGYRRIIMDDCSFVGNMLDADQCLGRLRQIGPEMHYKAKMDLPHIGEYDLGALWWSPQSCSAAFEAKEILDHWMLETRQNIKVLDWWNVLEKTATPAKIKEIFHDFAQNQADCLSAHAREFSDSRKYPEVNQTHRNLPVVYRGVAEVLRGLSF